GNVQRRVEPGCKQSPDNISVLRTILRKRKGPIYDKGNSNELIQDDRPHCNVWLAIAHGAARPDSSSATPACGLPRTAGAERVGRISGPSRSSRRLFKIPGLRR